MDVLENVRSLRSDVEGPTSAESAAAFDRLERAIANERRAPTRRRHRGIAWIGAATSTAVVAATALVVASVAGLGVASRPAHPGVGIGVVAPPANAESVLNRAARLASSSAPSKLAPGQYLRVETRVSQLITWRPGTGQVDRASSTASWVRHTTEVVYVPADRSGDWIRITNLSPVTISNQNGSDVDAAIAQWRAKYPMNDIESVQYLPGGLMPSHASDNRLIPYGSPATDLSAVPTDPAAFLTWLKAQQLPHGVTGDDYVNQTEVDVIVSYLQANVLPAKLRATMFKALALIPGASLVDTSGTSSTVQYKGHDLDRITIDTSTGLVTAYEAFLNEPEGANRALGSVPAGIPDISTVVGVTTLDRLPAALKAGLDQNGNG